MYRIKLGVIDDSDCACFVVFDNEVKQILGKNCVEILDPLLLKGDLSDIPTLLFNLIDKTFLFIIEDVDYTGSLLLISKASSIIEGKK
ncbi:hypothetical protein Ahy_B09g096466 [Arachis hypogaea]|uniref:Replication factor A C-terminal domain-containing protein n=1 Tax=Arachis hypogaea TaxID=3818 RepID=A0A444XKU0_ARAHY|nr:hypothetical protein Ahy_B09g096466 [Arachis hypogaea]